ncbi:MAG: hypothetical protein ACYS0G_06955 [Planctomycetota bacterium]|jgi:hypothetical protein
MADRPSLRPPRRILVALIGIFQGGLCRATAAAAARSGPPETDKNSPFEQLGKPGNAGGARRITSSIDGSPGTRHREHAFAGGAVLNRTTEARRP